MVAPELLRRMLGATGTRIGCDAAVGFERMEL